MKKMSILLFMFVMITGSVFADNQYQHYFNVAKAKQRFDQIHSKLTSKNVKLPMLSNYIEQLQNLEDQAEACVKKSSVQLKSINELLKSSQLDRELLIKQDEYKYLQEKKVFYSKHLSECRFYVYRSEQALVSYRNTLQKVNTGEILKRGVPIWGINASLLNNLSDKITVPVITRLLGLDKLSFSQLIFGGIIVLLQLFVGLYARYLFRKWKAKRANVRLEITSLAMICARNFVPFILLVAISVVFSSAFLQTSKSALIGVASNLLLGFLVLHAVSNYLFSPPDGVDNFLKLPKQLGKRFHHRITALLLCILVGCLGSIVLTEQYFTAAVIDVVLTLYTTVLMVLTFSVFWLCCRHAVFKLLLCILLIALLAIEWSGFHHLSVFLTLGIFGTITFSILAISAWLLTGFLYRLIDDNKYSSARAIRHFFRIKLYRSLNELLLIKFIVYVVIVAFLVLALMEVWGGSENIIDTVSESLLSGFTAAGIKLIPLRFVAAIITFAVIMLFGRLCAAIVAKKQIHKDEQDRQVAIASVTVYAFFAIALLFSLFVLGVDFTGLAIIAGALSVGVGIGLQNIVNNFVSGIILLLEKPIKPGDRVIVGDTEGFVTKIRLRSTQIKTLAKEDVIIPNADLISNQVTNYMFRDQQWRVVCQVGVAYGSDVALVEKVLLDVAAEHPDVLKESSNEPKVLFRQFGDSSLIFELWSIIPDVNKKFMIASELNFKIDEAFRANHITIAFPQRDLHVKEHIVIDQA